MYKCAEVYKFNITCKCPQEWRTHYDQCCLCNKLKKKTHILWSIFLFRHYNIFLLHCLYDAVHAFFFSSGSSALDRVFFLLSTGIIFVPIFMNCFLSQLVHSYTYVRVLQAADFFFIIMKLMLLLYCKIKNILWKN